MSIEITINCDALNCLNSIDCSGNEPIDDLINDNEWHNDPTTEEYHYCSNCWPEVQAEYDEMLANGELD